MAIIAMNPIANAITITITITITNPNPIANPGVPRIPARRLQTGGIRVPVRPSAGERRQARRRLDNGLHGRREGQVRTRPLPLLPSPPAPTGTIKSGPNTRHRCRCCSCGMAIYYIFFYTFRTFSMRLRSINLSPVLLISLISVCVLCAA